VAAVVAAVVAVAVAVCGCGCGCGWLGVYAYVRLCVFRCVRVLLFMYVSLCVRVRVDT